MQNAGKSGKSGRSGPVSGSTESFTRSCTVGYRVFTGRGRDPHTFPRVTPSLLRDANPRPSAVRCGGIEISPNGMRVFASGRPVDLTKRELELLVALAERRNRVVPRVVLYELVWHQRMAYRDRSVDVIVRKLRVKLAAVCPGWNFLHTHFGVGYRFSAERVDPDG
jgi:DNA-binding response OmpR family regulator